MQNLIKIYHVVQELQVFSLTDHGRTDFHSDYSAHLRVMQFTHIHVQLDTEKVIC